MTRERNLTEKVIAALGLRRFSGLYVWALLILIFGLWVPSTFLTSSTLQSVLAQQAVTGIVGVGLVFAMASGAFDLSIGGVVGGSAAIVAELLIHGWASVPAIAVALAFGVAIGLLNSIVVVRLRVDPFIGTLGMQAILFAILGGVTNEQEIVNIPAGYGSLATDKVAGIPLPFVIMLAVAIVAWYALEWTPFGRRLEATGSNRESARLAGVRTGRMMTSAYVASGLGAAIGGAILLSQIEGVDPTTGSEFLLPVYSTVFVGATQIRPGRFNVWGTLLAVYLLATGQAGLELVGAQNWETQLFYGVVLIVAVALAGTRYRAKRKHETELATDDLPGGGGTVMRDAPVPLDSVGADGVV